MGVDTPEMVPLSHHHHRLRMLPVVFFLPIDSDGHLRQMIIFYSVLCTEEEKNN